MRIKRIAWLLAVAAFLTAVVLAHLYPDKAMRRQLRQVAVDRRDAFIDITLPVVSKSCDTHGGCIVETDGLYNGQSTGLTVTFAPDMRASTFTDQVETTKVYPTAAGITFVAEGPRGRSLLHLIAATYGKPVSSASVPKTIVMTAIAFEGNPANIQKEPLKFKVVHPSEKDSLEYFELFVNTDLANDRVQLSEKDIGYRPAVLKAFGLN